MNRLFQGTLAFVMTLAAISGVSGKEAKQLTDAESKQIVGGVFGMCTPLGPCDSAGLTEANAGQAGVAIPHACPLMAACRGCKSASIYRQCQWFWAGSCNGITGNCGEEWEGGVCNGAGGCVFDPPLSVFVEDCYSFNCTGNL